MIYTSVYRRRNSAWNGKATLHVVVETITKKRKFFQSSLLNKTMFVYISLNISKNTSTASDYLKENTYERGGVGGARMAEGGEGGGGWGGGAAGWDLLFVKVYFLFTHNWLIPECWAVYPRWPSPSGCAHMHWPSPSGCIFRCYDSSSVLSNDRWRWQQYSGWYWCCRWRWNQPRDQWWIGNFHIQCAGRARRSVLTSCWLCYPSERRHCNDVIPGIDSVIFWWYTLSHSSCMLVTNYRTSSIIVLYFISSPAAAPADMILGLLAFA